MVNPISCMGVNVWYGDHDPNISETTTAGTISQYDNYINYTTGKTWICLNPTIDNLIWSSGDLINTVRTYSSQSLSFGTGRQPNVNHDTLILVSLQQTSTLVTPATVNIQIDSGSGFSTVSTSSISGVVSTIIHSISFIVPKNSSYKLVNSSGSNSINSLYELTL